MPPQFEPPALPGCINESFSAGGWKMPSERYCSMRLRQARVSNQATPHASSGVIFVCRTKAGGAVGNGYVGEGCSPGTASCGTALSSIGNSGVPLWGSIVNRNPVYGG